MQRQASSLPHRDIKQPDRPTNRSDSPANRDTDWQSQSGSRGSAGGRKSRCGKPEPNVVICTRTISTSGEVNTHNEAEKDSPHPATGFGFEEEEGADYVTIV